MKKTTSLMKYKLGVIIGLLSFSAYASAQEAAIDVQLLKDINNIADICQIKPHSKPNKEQIECINHRLIVNKDKTEVKIKSNGHLYPKTHIQNQVKMISNRLSALMAAPPPISSMETSSAIETNVCQQKVMSFVENTKSNLCFNFNLMNDFMDSQNGNTINYKTVYSALSSPSSGFPEGTTCKKYLSDAAIDMCFAANKCSVSTDLQNAKNSLIAGPLFSPVIIFLALADIENAEQLASSMKILCIPGG